MDLLGGIASIGSSLLNYFGASNANENNLAATEAENAARRGDTLYYAKNSIKLRAKDAEEAGIHPLYAMGAPSISPAATTVGTSINTMAPLAKGLHDLGQDVSRASLAQAAPAAKVDQVARAQSVVSNDLDLENKKLNNEILKARLATLTQPGTPPGAFDVPENKKPEERPPLMAGGYRWKTNPNTSPMKAWEDQYGDEGPVASMLPIGILANDAYYNWANHPNVHDNFNRMGQAWAAVARMAKAAKSRMLTGGGSGYYEGR